LAAVSIPPAGTPADIEIEYRVKAGRVVAGVEVRVTGDDGTVLPRDGKTVGEFEIRGRGSPVPISAWTTPRDS